jgi:hypothetical protein
MKANIEIVKRQINLHRTFLRDYIQSFHPQIPLHPRVKFTEIQYAPEQGDEDLEFLELRNYSDGSLDLSGWSVPAVGFSFPAGSAVPAGSALIIARSPGDLVARYAGRPLPPVFGPYTGRLANEGEELRLLDAGPGQPATIDYLKYDNDAPWPVLLPGYSIELVNASLDVDNDRPESWVSSAQPGGTPGADLPSFIRGSSNGDSEVNLTDVIFALNYLFRGGPAPPCEDAADSNDDGKLDITDSINLLNHLFQGAVAPPPPYPGRGIDPTPDDLDCAV